LWFGATAAGLEFRNGPLKEKAEILDEMARVGCHRESSGRIERRGESQAAVEQ